MDTASITSVILILALGAVQYWRRERFLRRAIEYARKGVYPPELSQQPLWAWVLGLGGSLFSAFMLVGVAFMAAEIQTGAGAQLLWGLAGAVACVLVMIALYLAPDLKARRADRKQPAVPAHHHEGSPQ